MTIFESLENLKPPRRETVVDKWLNTLSEQDRLDFITASNSGEYPVTALFRVAVQYGYESSFTALRTWVQNVKG